MNTQGYKNLTLILGGTKSGKSDFAITQGNTVSGRKIFLATAEILDEEMRKRVERHIANRGSSWETVEEPAAIEKVIVSYKKKCDVLVCDCITLWLSNTFSGGTESGKKEFSAVSRLLDTIGSVKYDIILVSNELGMGIVPANKAARSFRDIAGKVNQMIAARASVVYWVAAGIPIKIKGEKK